MSKRILVLSMAALLVCCLASSMLGATLVSGFEDGSFAGWSICGWGGTVAAHTLDTNAAGNNSAKGLTLSVNPAGDPDLQWIFAGFQFALAENLAFQNCTSMSFDLKSDNVLNCRFRAFLNDGSEWRWYGNNFGVSSAWTTFTIVPAAFWMIGGPSGSTFTSIDQMTGLWIDTDIGMVSNLTSPSMEVDNLVVDGDLITKQTSISGTVDLKDYIGDKDIVGIKVDFRQNGASVKTVKTVLKDDGTFSIAGLDAGTYDIAFKAPQFLTTLVTGVTVNQYQDTAVNVSLPNGDLDGDDEVTSTDLSVLGLSLGLMGE